MKKNYVFRTAMCLGVAVMLTLCGASGTYAKYTGTIQGTADSARVAKFAFSIGDGSTIAEYPTTKSYTVDIFNTVKDTLSADAENDIDLGSSDVIIAPGSWGFVPIIIENKGEVTVNVTFTGTITNADSIPLEYGVKLGSTNPTFSELSTLCTLGNETDLNNKLNAEFAGDIETEQRKTASNKNVKQGYLVWYWPFSGADGADTALGEGGTATVSVKIDCTATQVD